MTNVDASPDLSETGFIKMSHYADALEDPSGDAQFEAQDDGADEPVSELQRVLLDEIRARPFRAIGWAAAAGLALGLFVSR
ncbi:MAG TPA: hypothetical protein VIU82_07580 [Bosea sp. (in: a-proteobacteria)]